MTCIDYILAELYEDDYEYDGDPLIATAQHDNNYIIGEGML